MILHKLSPALLLALALPAAAQRGAPAPAAAPSGAAKTEPMANPLPADKSVPQTITVNGKTIHYTATVGTISVKNVARRWFIMRLTSEER